MAATTYRSMPRTDWVRSAFGGLFETMSLVSAAHECSMARRERRAHHADDLHTLGIDETAFKRTYKRR